MNRSAISGNQWSLPIDTPVTFQVNELAVLLLAAHPAYPHWLRLFSGRIMQRN